MRFVIVLAVIIIMSFPTDDIKSTIFGKSSKITVLPSEVQSTRLCQVAIISPRQLVKRMMTTRSRRTRSWRCEEAVQAEEGDDTSRCHPRHESLASDRRCEDEMLEVTTRVAAI